MKDFKCLHFLLKLQRVPGTSRLQVEIAQQDEIQLADLFE